jgi:hypothetical protein
MRNTAAPGVRQLKGRSRCRGLTLLFFSLLLLPGIVWPPATAAAQTAQASPILTYRVTHDLLPTEDVYSVEVYEDGTAHVHYPPYMKKAGDYIVQLSPEEVQEIRLLLQHPLVQNFDPEKVQAEKKRKDAESSEVFAISDNTYSDFVINLQDTSASTATKKTKHIRWANLNSDAKRYPEIGIFRKLADIQDSLLELDQHPTAQRVE